MAEHPISFRTPTRWACGAEARAPQQTDASVFGTAVPLHGLSGAIRKLAYRYPDHYWFLKMLGDRVDSWEHRVRRVMPVALPLVALGLVVRLPRR